MSKSFDLLALGEVLLRLSPPTDERLVRGETLQKQVGGAELNVVSGVSLFGLRNISTHAPHAGRDRYILFLAAIASAHLGADSYFPLI